MNNKRYALFAALILGNQMIECRPVSGTTRLIQVAAAAGSAFYFGRMAFNSVNGESLDSLRKKADQTINDFQAKVQYEAKKPLTHKMGEAAIEGAMLSGLTPEQRAEQLRKKHEAEAKQRQAEGEALRDAHETKALDDQGLTQKRYNKAFASGLGMGFLSAVGVGIVAEVIIQVIHNP
ncbi:MAG TPA: hypothetical protein VFF04_01105 [Candidatus Babeliales bacterium]|nr:hypothetical protein [Candidatus Babeliales bacterium]